MELQTGGNAATMSLELYNKDDTLVSKLDNDSALLGSYHADNGMRLHVSKQKRIKIACAAICSVTSLMKKNKL